MNRKEIIECLRLVPLRAEDEPMREPMLAFAAECPDAALESMEILLARYGRGLAAIRDAAEADTVKAERQLLDAYERRTDRQDPNSGNPDEAYL